LKHLSGLEIVDMLDKLASDPKKSGYFKSYGEVHNWTHICGLWELPYVSPYMYVGTEINMWIAF
jgi:hypothetical protein